VCYPGPPAVVGVWPPDSAQNVTVTAGLVVTFNEVVYVGPPVPGFAPPDLRLMDGGSALPGDLYLYGRVTAVEAYDERWAWSVRLDRLPPFTSQNGGPARLAELWTYRGSIAGGVDAHGNRNDLKQTWSFVTGDFTRPYVTAAEPPNGAFGVLEGQVVTAYLNEPLNGTEGVSFVVQDDQGVVAGVVTYEPLAGGGALHFTPAAPLTTDTVYQVTLSGAWDEHGNQMAGVHAWQFATRSTTPFVVEETNPAAGAVGAPLTATVAITFNKELLAGSESLVSFALVEVGGPFGAPVMGQVVRQGPGLRFTPDAPLEPGAVYQVRVVGATSILGDRQATPHRWSFETLDPNPPTVIRTEPAREATGVSPYADVLVFPSASLRTSFDKAVKPGGQGAALTVMGPDEKPVAGHLSWLTGDENAPGHSGETPAQRRASDYCYAGTSGRASPRRGSKLKGGWGVIPLNPNLSAIMQGAV